MGNKHLKGGRWDAEKGEYIFPREACDYIEPPCSETEEKLVPDFPQHMRENQRHKSSGVVRVAVIARTSDGIITILVMKCKKKDAYKFPGGKVEAGESLEEAATREVLEETGITLQRDELKALGGGLMIDAGGHPLRFFIAEVDESRFAQLKKFGDDGEIVRSIAVERIFEHNFLTRNPDPDAPPLFYDNRQLAYELEEYLERAAMRRLDVREAESAQVP